MILVRAVDLAPAHPRSKVARIGSEGEDQRSFYSPRSGRYRSEHGLCQPDLMLPMQLVPQGERPADTGGGRRDLTLNSSSPPKPTELSISPWPLDGGATDAPYRSGFRWLGV